MADEFPTPPTVAPLPLLKRRSDSKAISFWKRFSPNHEFLLSLLASCVLHVAAILLLAVFGALLLGLNTDKVTPTVDNLVFAGGGGTPGGRGNQNAAFDVNLQEAIPFNPDKSAEPPRPVPIPVPNDPLKVQPTDANPPEKKPPELQTSTPGKAGPGSGGGKGSGIGPGEGSGMGPGKESKRTLRRDRWTIQIDIEVFPERLINLQAVVAVPVENDKFQVYRDLRQQPARSTLETFATLNQINLMWWRNDDKLAVQTLANYLGLSKSPRYVAVFIPRDLEDELLKKELAHKGLTEDEIAGRWLETVFHAERKGGRWLVTILEQRARR